MPSLRQPMMVFALMLALLPRMEGAPPPIQCAQQCAEHFCNSTTAASPCLATNGICYNMDPNTCSAHPDFCWCGGTPLPFPTYNCDPKMKRCTTIPSGSTPGIFANGSACEYACSHSSQPFPTYNCIAGSFKCTTVPAGALPPGVYTNGTSCAEQCEPFEPCKDPKACTW